MKHFGDAKIENFHGTVRGDPNVGRFKIAVDDSAGVCGFHGGGDLDSNG